MFNRVGPVPLYHQVGDEIRNRIRSGAWPPHYKLKAEPELAEELGVSRGTLRQALRTLVSEGLLAQVQGKGTFVTATSVDLPLTQGLVTMHELLAEVGRPFTTEVLERRLGDGPTRVRKLLDLETEERLLQLRRRLVVEDEPFVVLDNYVRLHLCPALEDVDFGERPLFDALENLCHLRVGWGQRHFSSTKAGQLADLLMINENEPVLYLEQITYLDDGTPLEYSDVWVRGERLRVATILTRPVTSLELAQRKSSGE